MKYEYKKIDYVEAVINYCSERGVKYPSKNPYKTSIPNLLLFLNKFKDFNMTDYMIKKAKLEIQKTNNKKIYDYRSEIIKIKYILLQQLTDHFNIKKQYGTFKLMTTAEYIKLIPRTTDEIYNQYKKNNNFVERQHIKSLLLLNAVKLC